MKKTAKFISVLLVIIMVAVPLTAINASAASKWITAWTTSMVNGSVSVAGLSLNDIIPSRSTVRSELTVTAAGTALRFQFSNQYGNAPIVINEATVGRTLKAGTGDIVNGSAVAITFDDSKSVTIAAGDYVWSDIINFPTSALEKITVSMFFRDVTYMKTVGLSNGRTFLNTANAFSGTSEAYVGDYNMLSEVKIASSTITYHTVPFLAKIETKATSDNACTAVFIGDSTLVNDTYLYYAQRIVDSGVTSTAVVNQAIVGNRLLSKVTGNLIGNLMGDSMMSRFDRDVLSLAGVKYCFVKIGLNDMIHQFSKSLGPNTPKYTVSDMIKGYQKLITMCHQKGIKIYFFTKSAWKGYSRAFLGQTDDLVWSQEAQDICDSLTSWIKNSKEHDGYIDCSNLEDPSDRTKLCSTFTPDGAHLTALGSIALADTIPLSYVGITKEGRSAAKINGVNPYKERQQIIYNMNHPTTTEAPTTEAPSTTKAATTDKPGTTAVAAGTTAAQTTASAITGTTSAQAPSYYIASSVTGATEDYTLPSYIPNSTVTVPEAASYVYTTAALSNNVVDTNGVDHIGGNSAIPFLLITFLVIVVVGAVVVLVIRRKGPGEQF